MICSIFGFVMLVATLYDVWMTYQMSLTNDDGPPAYEVGGKQCTSISDTTQCSLSQHIFMPQKDKIGRSISTSIDELIQIGLIFVSGDELDTQKGKRKV